LRTFYVKYLFIRHEAGLLRKIEVKTFKGRMFYGPSQIALKRNNISHDQFLEKL
jgi:hypothetical protein